MSSQVDASGSSSMGDVHQMFHGCGAGWGLRKDKPGERSSARLRLAGLGPEVSEAQVKEFFSRFYSTVGEVHLETSQGKSRGCGFVVFRFGGERDKAVSELQGRALLGYPLALSKVSAVPDGSAKAGAGAAAALPPRGAPLTDEQIFSVTQARAPNLTPSPVPTPSPRPHPNPKLDPPDAAPARDRARDARLQDVGQPARPPSPQRCARR